MSLSFSSDPRLEFSPVCRGLLVLNVAVFALGALGGALNLPGVDSASILHAMGLFPEEVVSEGKLWTPLTYMFLHANWVHVGVNMMGLYLLGPDLERALGSKGFLALYVAAGVAGALGFLGVSYFWFDTWMPVVGASGAIMGLLGAIVALYPQRVYVLIPLMIPLRASVLAVLLVTTHVFFMLTPYGGRVAYDVHLFGGLAGYAVAWTLAARHRREWRDVFPPSERVYARVELESLAHELARVEAPREAAPEAWDRYCRLREALRYEDVPWLEEVRALKRD